MISIDQNLCAEVLGVPTLADHRAVAQGTSGTLARPICADLRCFKSSMTSIKQRVMGSSMQANRRFVVGKVVHTNTKLSAGGTFVYLGLAERFAGRVQRDQT